MLVDTRFIMFVPVELFLAAFAQDLCQSRGQGFGRLEQPTLGARTLGKRLLSPDPGGPLPLAP